MHALPWSNASFTIAVSGSLVLFLVTMGRRKNVIDKKCLYYGVKKRFKVKQNVAKRVLVVIFGALIIRQWENLLLVCGTSLTSAFYQSNPSSLLL